MTEIKVPAEIAEKYEFVGAHSPIVHIIGLGTVDFRKITVAQADAVVRKTNHKYFKPKEKNTKESK